MSSVICVGLIIYVFLLGLIDKCQYEMKVLKSSEMLLHADLHDQLANAIDAAKCGVANPIICSLCRQKILMESMFVFRYVFYTNNKIQCL